MKSKQENYCFLSLKAKSLLVCLCFFSRAETSQVAKTSLYCSGIRKTPTSPLTSSIALGNVTFICILFHTQAGCGVLYCPPLKFHSARELAQAVTNNSRLALIVLITLSIPHLRIKAFRGNLKFTLARILSLLDTSPQVFKLSKRNWDRWEMPACCCSPSRVCMKSPTGQLWL